MKKMTISELQSELESIRLLHGDIPVLVETDVARGIVPVTRVYLSSPGLGKEPEIVIASWEDDLENPSHRS